MAKKNTKNQIVVFQAKSGAIELRGDLKKETLWANLQQIADLFETDKSGISRHIKNIYQTDELEQKSTVAKIATVQKEGKREVEREVEFYNEVKTVVVDNRYVYASVSPSVFKVISPSLGLPCCVDCGVTLLFDRNIFPVCKSSPAWGGKPCTNKKLQPLFDSLNEKMPSQLLK